MIDEINAQIEKVIKEQESTKAEVDKIEKQISDLESTGK